MTRGVRALVLSCVLLLGASALPREGRAQAASLPWPVELEEAVALRRAEALARSPRAQAVGRGGVQPFPYGQGQPYLRCAPWRTCHILLQEGEELRDRSGGDLVRWKVWAIRGPGSSYLVAIKPRFCDISTNLLFTTDRRIYDVMLDSPPCGGADTDSTKLNTNLPYTSVLWYSYPEEEEPGGPFSLPVAAAPAPRQEASPKPAAEGSPSSAPPGSDLYFRYEVKYDPGFPWLPSYVYDNGTQTFVRLPERARRAEIPVLYEVAPDGSLEMVDYDYDPETNRFTVFRVTDRLALVVPRGGGRGGPLRLMMRRLPEEK